MNSSLEMSSKSDRKLADASLVVIMSVVGVGDSSIFSIVGVEAVVVSIQSNVC